MSPIEDRQQTRRLQFFTFSLGTEIPSPEYWFGEFVDFCWVDENSGESHCEMGVVFGVAWSQEAREWQYVIVWLSSTIHPDEHYPIFTEELVPGGILCKI